MTVATDLASTNGETEAFTALHAATGEPLTNDQAPDATDDDATEEPASEGLLSDGATTAGDWAESLRTLVDPVFDGLDDDLRQEVLREINVRVSLERDNLRKNRVNAALTLIYFNVDQNLRGTDVFPVLARLAENLEEEIDANAAAAAAVISQHAAS